MDWKELLPMEAFREEVSAAGVDSPLKAPGVP
jgi:hypothetical protein